MQVPVQEVRRVVLICLGLTLDTPQYGTLQFSKFDEIRKKGYHAAVEILDKWEDEGKLPVPNIHGHGADKDKGSRKGRSARRNSV